MIHKTLNLKEEGYNVEGGTLETFCASGWLDQGEVAPRPAVIVVPGGAYGFCSKREAEPVAVEFLSRGYQTFVLTYLTASEDVAYPEEFLELCSAVDYVKKHHKELNVNPEQVFAVGFSAGGHLVGNLATQYKDASKIAGQPMDAKPTAVGLSYPVISERYGHVDSHNNLLRGYSGEARAELSKTLNLDEAVTKETSPSYLWSTVGDMCVPPENAIQFARALQQNGVLYELHVFPQGNHGLSTCDVSINQAADFLSVNAKWLDECDKFFKLFVK